MADLEQAAVWHRQIAALVAAADRAGIATDELPVLRARLTAQIAEFTQAASREGAQLPALQPSASEISAVMPALGDLGPTAARQLVRTASTTLDAADAALRAPVTVSPSAAPEAGGSPTNVAPPTAGPPEQAVGAATPGGTTPGSVPAAGSPGGTTPATPRAAAAGPASGIERWPVAARNGLVYGVCALVVLGIQAYLFVAFSATSLPLLGPLCLLVLPAFGWLAGWLIIGGIFEPAPGTTLNRTPRFGAVISLIPDALLLAGLAVLFLTRLFT